MTLTEMMEDGKREEVERKMTKFNCPEMASRVRRIRPPKHLTAVSVQSELFCFVLVSPPPLRHPRYFLFSNIILLYLPSLSLFPSFSPLSTYSPKAPEYTSQNGPNFIRSPKHMRHDPVGPSAVRFPIPGMLVQFQFPGPGLVHTDFSRVTSPRSAEPS